MYIRTSHQPRDPADVLEVIERNMFGTLVTGLTASHLPFILENGPLYAHMARANPQSSMLDGEALVIFLGPHDYISPSWYADRATAPTWDYVAVHCYGRIRVHDGDETRRSIERLVERMEPGRPDRWSIDALSEESVRALLANVVSFEIPRRAHGRKVQAQPGREAGANARRDRAARAERIHSPRGVDAPLPVTPASRRPDRRLPAQWP
ncbi:MAG TPA: FMN-binding negative transcriptional regulator [Thermoanaerobaculia bacterium]|nr:FMN-binding negative transcriptional regulator [Thermoanaerobaculia bacterium]